MMKKTLTILLALTLLIVTADEISADRYGGSLSGVLVAFETGKPIADAVVRIEGTSRVIRSDNAGRFVFSDLDDGEYTVLVDLRGYQMETVVVAVRDGRCSEIRISLRAAKEDENATCDEDYKRDKPQRDISLSAPSVQIERSRTRTNMSSAQGLSSGKTKRKSGRIGMPKPMPDREYRCDPGFYASPSDMFFRDYGTNGFVDTRRDRFSTFAIDVDDASYNIAREYLSNGTLPPRESIRIEEFINHFDYGYNVSGQDRFRVFHELTPSPFSGHTVLKLGVKGQELAKHDRRPLRLTFIIDVSGSMRNGNRMGLVRESLQMLLEQLNRDDRVSIVAYGDAARVVLEPTPASDRRRIMRAVSSLRPGGSTYAEAGLKLGYKMANRQYVEGYSNRVILCSDGVANVGQTSPDAIMRDIGRFARKGLSLSTFGYGMGNYNDVLLEQLALKGNGQYAYVNSREEAQKLFVREFVSNMELVARDVKIQVEFDPDAVRSYRLLGYENRDIADHRFRNSREDGGEVGAGQEVTVLYELELAPRARLDRLATVFVRWTDPDSRTASELNRDVTWSRHSGRFESGRPELRLAVVAARFAELLKGTGYASESTFADLLRLATPLEREMGDEQTRELVDLIRRASSLTGYDWEYHSRLQAGDGGAYKK